MFKYIFKCYSNTQDLVQLIILVVVIIVHIIVDSERDFICFKCNIESFLSF